MNRDCSQRQSRFYLSKTEIKIEKVREQENMQEKTRENRIYFKKIQILTLTASGFSCIIILAL